MLYKEVLYFWLRGYSPGFVGKSPEDWGEIFNHSPQLLSTQSFMVLMDYRIACTCDSCGKPSRTCRLCRFSQQGSHVASRKVGDLEIQRDINQFPRLLSAQSFMNLADYLQGVYCGWQTSSARWANLKGATLSWLPSARWKRWKIWWGGGLLATQLTLINKKKIADKSHSLTDCWLAHNWVIWLARGVAKPTKCPYNT